MTGKKRTVITILSVLLVCLLGVLASGCAVTGAADKEKKMANPKVKFTTNMGEFTAEIYEDKVPNTAKNFLSLVEKGYYNGIIFHRVIAGFMIQGGDPTGSGMGGPGYTIKDEFHKDLKHDGKGVLSMANAGPDTGGSQFFITLAPTPWLDGHHAIFGRIVEGQKVVDMIGVVQTDFRDRPLKDVVMEKVEVIKK